MRPFLVFLAGCGALAACALNEPAEVSATPPTVSYNVTGNDVSEANVQASEYCARYGMAPQFQGIRASGSGNLAHYTCVASAGSTVAPSGAATTAPYAATPPPGVKCADWWHQSRPGGSNYTGPPVPGCPQR